VVERRPEKAGVASSILAPGTRICFLLAISYPSYQLNWNVSSNQASATKVSSLSITFANPATIRIYDFPSPPE
jgi:predicted secreted Zn-dependent protease